MKSSTLLSLAISLLPITAAWEVTWNDADGNDHSKSGHGPSDCIKIDNPKGHLFKIDAQGENDINMLLFTNSACSGDPAGMATDVFSKDASKDLLGFKVVSLSSTTASGDSATATATATGTGTGNSTTHGATTATGTATTKTTHSSHATSTSGSSSIESKTTQTTVVTSAPATTSSSPSGSTSSSSAASASTSNAAVRVAGSSSEIAKGLVGGIVGLAVVPFMI